MEYLKRVLGIEVLYENKALEHLPNFISTRYDSQKVSLNGQKTVFLYPKTELEQVETLKKHLERVKKVADCPVILVLEQITARQKEYLLREKIAFIVDGKQIYLPFMAAYLQERCDAEKSDREEILPSAQMLLLYFIYEGAKELSTSQAAKDLDLTPTSISRASKQLEGMGFLRSRKIGVQKILFSENSAKELFYKAEKVLLNPVKRTVYVPCEEVKTELLESGYSALAEYSMLNAPSVRCYASEKVSQWNYCMTKDLQDSNSQVTVEMWRYDPRKLSKEKMVDGLSLALSLKEDLKKYVKEKDLQAYNAALPSEEEINDYAHKMSVYKTITNGGVALKLRVLNKGTAKATDIRISIVFPKDIFVYDIDDIEKMKEPKAPKLPPNPIEKAEERFMSDLNPVYGLLKNSMDGMQPFYSARSLPIIDPAIFNNSNSSVFESISIRDNSIFAECNQLPHKDDTEFDGIYIVPARKGKFKVSVSLMCSEYIEPKVHDIEFEIV